MDTNGIRFSTGVVVWQCKWFGEKLICTYVYTSSYAVVYGAVLYLHIIVNIRRTCAATVMLVVPWVCVSVHSFLPSRACIDPKI